MSGPGRRPNAQIPFLDLKSQYLSIKKEVDEAISAVIETSAYVGGPHLAAFEKAFAAYVGLPHCVGVGSGTDGLEIALQSLDLPPGSEVLVPANSFIATAEAVTRSGLSVVFCDVREEDFTLALDDCRGKVSRRSRALIAVHLYGHACDLAGLTAFAQDHGLSLLEDCAQAHGARWRSRHVGWAGRCGVFSFSPGKNLGAYGDGGAIVTADGDLARHVRLLGNHGRASKHDHAFEGRSSRLDGLQAAVLAVKLRHLDEWLTARRKAATLYREGLAGVGDLVLPGEGEDVRHAWHLFVVRSERRDALRRHLGEVGIEAGLHYPVALPDAAAYARLRQRGSCPVATRLAGQVLSLPVGEHMTARRVETVVRAIKAFFGHRR